MIGSPWGREEQGTSETEESECLGKSSANSNSRQSRSTYYAHVPDPGVAGTFHLSPHTSLPVPIIISQLKRKRRPTEISNLTRSCNQHDNFKILLQAMNPGVCL